MTRARGDWSFRLVLALLVVTHFYLRPRFLAGPWAPDFLLLALLIFSIRSRPGVAALAGLVVGLVDDTLMPSRFGAGMLAHTIVGYVAAWGRAVFFADNLLVNAGLFLAGTWVRNLIILLASGLSVGALLASVALWSTLQAIATAVAGVLVMVAIRHRVDFRLEE